MTKFLSSEYLIRFKKDITSSPKNPLNSKMIVVLLEIDHSNIASDYETSTATFALYYNHYFVTRYFSLPDYSDNPNVRSLLATTQTTYVQLTLPEDHLPEPDFEFTIVPDIAKSLVKTWFSPDCSVTQDYTSMYGSYPFLACPSLSITFDGSAYQSDSVNSSSVTFQYNDIVEPKDFSINLACKNDCACDKNECVSGNSACPVGTYYESQALFGSGSQLFGQCIECPPECLSCQDGICTSCKTTQEGSFFIGDLDYGSSIYKSCDPCDFLNLTCVTTEQPDFTNFLNLQGFFYLNFDFRFRIYVSEECPKECDECVDQVSCDSCKDHYLFHPDKKQCVNKKLNCEYYDIEIKVCDLCKTGYYMDSHKLCHKCSSHCETCSEDINSNVICSKCFEGFILNSNKCISVPFNLNNSTFEIEISSIKEIPCSSSVCSTCKNKNICLECPDRYFLFNDDHIPYSTCKQCPVNSSSCFQNQENVGFISECDPATPVLNKKLNQCFPAVQECSEYDYITFKCKMCNPTYYLKTTNSKQVCQKCLSNCKVCDPFLGCVSCNTKMFLKNGECFDCPNNCLNCINESICLRCEDNFELSLNSNLSYSF
jgi:hypothetical protein